MPTVTEAGTPTDVLSPTGHQGSEGMVLAPESGQETVYPGALCRRSAPVREYEVVAINVEVTVNRFLDYDPVGRMYVLERDLERARREEAQNKAARLEQSESAVSIGLQGDAIQPLTLRVNQGDCLRVSLRNALEDEEPASFHLHGSSLHMVKTGTPAIATNPNAIAGPGETVTYEWMVEEDEPEGTHYFHSHGDDREQTAHGLFGAVIVEPKGSVYLDPLSGEELVTGWAAIIQDPNGSDFREFAIYYHEIGNERFRNLDRFGRRVAFVDEFAGSYKPGGRAMNYRSEPFMNRMALGYESNGSSDPSLAYSSYSFGDPATPVARAYLGDPVKQRVIHGGSEVFHVHHVHGGSTRWRRQPDAEPSAFDSGFDKTPALLPQASARTDSQAIGPSETYDLENECGSGGCQHSVGDYLIHCHVAHHYIAGMWMIWRVYNTLQDGETSQDALPPLMELPDRLNGVVPAVTSPELADSTVNWKGREFRITQENLAEWVERQLPPAGIPKGYDASVLDWRREGDLYLNEPETDIVWPGYRPKTPGTRPAIYFNPLTGKLAYPMLRPHFAKRPPFAPNHGPAPFLDPIRHGTDPPQPGENGPWSLCPAGTTIQKFAIHAINLPITLNRRANIVDPVGQLFVLKEEEDAIRPSRAAKRTRPVAEPGAVKEVVDMLSQAERPILFAGGGAFFSGAAPELERFIDITRTPFYTAPMSRGL
ncbi:MAG: multicopper oxidase domain-containing protein, partial [Chloroflexi bacterium]|nr:multicopper oxidase domain-containing protein [Chloroflexota bacterium]